MRNDSWRTFPRWRQAERVQHLALRHDACLIMGVRFAYGLQIAGPGFIDTTAIRAPRFLIFNALRTVVWASVVAGSGWLFGHVLETLLSDMCWIESAAFACVLATIVAIWMGRSRRRRRRARCPDLRP